MQKKVIKPTLGLEMAGIVKAVIKELEPEDSFKILAVDYYN